MNQNLILNPNFLNGSLNWNQFKWYDDNTINFLTTGGLDDGCCKLTVRSVGDPGQSSISQSVKLRVGQQYTLEFYAKRTGNVDVWAEVSSDAGTQFSPSFRPLLISGAGYTKVTYTFTASGSGNSANTSIRLIAGSAGGTAFLDNVKIMGEPITTLYAAGNLVCITLDGTNLRKTIGGDRQCYLKAGTKFVIADTSVSGGYTWIKVLWGGTHATYMYVRSDCCEDLGAAYTDKRELAIDLGLSFADKGYNGDDLDIPADLENGGWCQRFTCFLCKAAGVSASNYPSFDDSKCSEGVKFFRDNGQFTEGSTSYAEGDWIYYSKGTATYQHVGLVTKISGNLISTVEGNVSNTVKKYTDKTLTTLHDDMVVYGFASPLYT